jgi:hypothetical protein
VEEKTLAARSSDHPKEVEASASPKQLRSASVVRMLRKYFRDRERRKIHARDLELINAAADRLNVEADDILAHQDLED